MKPKYPVYVISKGRARNERGSSTAQNLIDDDIPFRLVVEPQEVDEYAEVFPRDLIEQLPFSNLGQGSIPARNWVWEHALEAGAERHWILDDNMYGWVRLYKGRRLPCHSAVALCTVEDFVDRYENVAIAGHNYRFFAGPWTKVPFYLNTHVYSSMLIRCDLPNRWRGRYNEDTDLCLQVLADGWCTILMNVFPVNKLKTMTTKGGNTDELYDGDGRLRMARALERQWPGVVTVDRRYGRPQHVINWKKFDTPLKRRSDVDFDKFAKVNEYGMTLKAIRKVQSDKLKQVQRDFASSQGDKV